MANLLSPENSKRTRARTTGIMFCCFTAFLLIFFLSYNFGLAQGNVLRSMISAIPLPCFLAGGLLQLNTPNTKRQTSLPWYRDVSVLQKLWLWPVFLIYIPILINSLMNNKLPDAVALPFETVGTLLVLYFIVQTLIARRASNHTK